MGAAIGEILPFAVGVAISPLPIIAVALMLVTPQASRNGPAFLVGWVLGLAVVGTIVLLVAAPTDASEGGEPAAWVDWLKLLLGVLLLLVATRQWRGRPHEGEEAAMPAWLGAVERFTAPKALAAGSVLAAANPKNLLLAVGAAAAIAQTGISGGEQAVAYGAFAFIGTLGVAAPVVVFFALGDRAPLLLGRLKDWLAGHNAAIMTVLCLVIAAKLLGDALRGFAG